jgi:hypothetical protein
MSKGKVFTAQDLRIGQKVFFVAKLAIVHCKISKISDEKIPCYYFDFESLDLKGWNDWTYQPNFFRKASEENSCLSIKVFLEKEEAEKQLNYDKKYQIKNLKSEINDIKKRIIKIKKLNLKGDK